MAKLPSSLGLLEDVEGEVVVLLTIPSTSNSLSHHS